MKLIMRLFPGEWRVRYGDEFLALLEDQPPGRGRWIEVVRCLIAAHLDRTAPPSFAPPVPAGRALVAAVLILAVAVGVLGTVFVGTASQSALRMAGDLLAPLAVILPVALVCAFMWTARRHGDRSIRSALPAVVIDGIVLTLIGLILVATLTPQLGFFEQAPWIEVRPFVDVVTAATWVERVQAVADLAGNALLFLVLGFALALQRGAPAAATVLPAAVAFAIVLEIGQAALGTGRPADSTDVIVRAIGAGLGYGLWRLAVGASGALRDPAAA